jgi:hypothetical protein
MDSTKESDSEYDSEHDSDVDMRMVDDVDTVDGIDLAGDVDVKKDRDNEVREYEVKDDKEEQYEDEDDGNEPRMIGHGEMVNTSADNVSTMVDDQPIVLPAQGQKMRKHTPQPQPPASAPQAETPEPCAPPQTPETHPLCELEHLGVVMLQKPRPAVPTL